MPNIVGGSKRKWSGIKMSRDPQSPVICSIPLGSTAVLTHFVADVLNSTKHRVNFATGATVLGSELAGKTLTVAKAPVDDQPGEAFAVDCPTPRRPDRAHLFAFGPPTEPKSYIPSRSTETNNEITRAGLSGRDNRDFGPKWAESGGGHPSVGVSRDWMERRSPREGSPQLVARTGVSTKKADGVSVGFVS